MWAKCVYFELLQSVYMYSNVKTLCWKIAVYMHVELQPNQIYVYVYPPLKLISKYIFFLFFQTFYALFKTGLLWEDSHCPGQETVEGQMWKYDVIIRIFSYQRGILDMH